MFGPLPKYLEIVKTDFISSFYIVQQQVLGEVRIAYESNMNAHSLNVIYLNDSRHTIVLKGHCVHGFIHIRDLC